MSIVGAVYTWEEKEGEKREKVGKMNRSSTLNSTHSEWRIASRPHQCPRG